MRRRIRIALALAVLASGSACGSGERGAPLDSASESPAAPAAGGANGAADRAPTDPIDAPNLLPGDIPIPEGLKRTSLSNAEPGSVIALFTGDLDPEAVARVFETGLREQGWSIDESRRRGEDLGLFAHKDQRIASVVVTRLSGKLHVELGVWEPND